MIDATADTAERTADPAPLTGRARSVANLKSAWTSETRPDPVGGGRPPSPERQLKRLLRKGGARQVALALFDIARNSQHPLCVQASKYIFDRIDGPLEKAIKHTLNIPSVSFEVHLNAPGPRALPALPVANEQRVIDITQVPPSI